MTIVKIGRTHLQDAVPLTLGQEFGGYVAQLDGDLARIEAVLPGLYELAHRRHRRRHRAQRAPRVRRARAPAKIAELTGLPFVSAPEQVRGARRRTTRSCSRRAR